MSFSPKQLRALAIAPRVTGTLSMLGSAFIIKSTIGEVMRETDTTYHRIMLGLSIVDFWSSLAQSMSTLPIPKDSGVWGAQGNQSTCSFQGFFVQQAYSVSMYSASLSVYYLLYSRYRWSEERLRSVETYFHLIPMTIGLGTGIAGFPLKLYNNAFLWCWIGAFPVGCKDSYRFGIESNCVRGDNYWIYRYAFAYAPMWLSILIFTGCMFLVYLTVLQHEKAIDASRCDGVAVREKSKRVACQTFWYIVGFYLTWLPGTILVILHQLFPSTERIAGYPFLFSVAALMPMQGFFNAAVFFRARYLKYRREYAASTSVTTTILSNNDDGRQ